MKLRGFFYSWHVIAHERDTRWVRTLRPAFLFGMPGLQWLRPERCAEADNNTLIIWTPSLAEAAVHDSVLLEAASSKHFVVANRDGPAHPIIDTLRHVEWTNASDIMWQWRVLRGTPADLVNRPEQ